MGSDAVEADDDLENIPATVMSNVIQELNHNGTWLSLAKNLKDRMGRRVISDESLSEMKKASSPGREIISILRKNLWSVSDLQALLERCHLYSILKFIDTNEPAKIIVPEEDSTWRIVLGYRISLAAEVCGSPYPDIQWYFNGKPLIGETSHELSLENFSLSNVGEYTFRIKQRLSGGVSELISPKYILGVEHSPPKILKDLEDVEIQAYEDITLSFEVTGYPEPQCFSWFKNNLFISRTEIPQLYKGAADIHSCGQYHCEISSTAGSCTTRRALVKVKEPALCSEKPEIITQTSPNQVYYVGDEVNLFCDVLCSKPVEFACFLNNEMLTESKYTRGVSVKSRSRYHYKYDLSYLLTKEQMDKENWKPLVFKFEVSSSSGRALSDDINLEVKTRDVKKVYTARNKWALLVGNSEYQHMGPLPAADNDIKTIEKNFVELGFRVLMLTNLNRTELQNAVQLFSTFIQKGDYVSFFYAGHGIHNDGKDYLIPVDTTVKYVSKTQNVCSETPCDDISIGECISLVWITNVLQRGEPALLFSIYDTCRQMKPKYDGCQSNVPHYQTALKNSYFIYATSENYEAYEIDGKNRSLLVDAMQSLMTRKIPVSELATQVLRSFHFPTDRDHGSDTQVPKICGDLALPLSLVDPSRPQENDKSESGVLMKWESLGGLGGVVQDCIALPDSKVKANVWWNSVCRKDGVTWVVSNCLWLTVKLSREGHPDLQEVDYDITVSTREKLQKSGKLKYESSEDFAIPHLQDLVECLVTEINFTYRGQLYKKELLLESPAISQQFFKGNYV